MVPVRDTWSRSSPSWLASHPRPPKPSGKNTPPRNFASLSIWTDQITPLGHLISRTGATRYAAGGVIGLPVYLKASMSDRQGELWNPRRLQDQEETLEALFTANSDAWTISGGYAWHLMSPRGHIEEKHLHDHKDLDVFVRPDLFTLVLPTLKNLGFIKAQTLHDDPSGSFVRYTRFKEGGKLVLDIYIEDIPSVLIDTYRIVEPNHLIGLYDKTHSSKNCIAVIEAKKLVAQGISPIGRQELLGE